MVDNISAAMRAAATGLRAQTMRMRVSAENVANANSMGQTPGADPYRRRIPVLEEATSRDGVRGVRVGGAVDDPADFKTKFDPSHPAADASGYVKLPNVETMMEMMDLRDASRAYEANLNMIEGARQMNSRALDILRR
jgi:flagellar basal-body rod protein FlgC